MTDQERMPTSAEEIETKARAGKYLTFKLANEEYGLEILKVREIIGLMDITSVPRAPHYIRGVINLRGKVIPVMELRSKFDMETTEDTDQTCIIVVDVASSEGSIITGTVVDSVSEVLDIQQGDIEDAPNFGVGVDTEFILGMAKVKDEIKILLDINRVLETSDLSMINKTGKVEEAELEEALA